MMTFLIAPVAIFVLMALWIAIDAWARKRLGERTQCAHAVADGVTRGYCGRHPESACVVKDEEHRPHRDDAVLLTPDS